MILKSHKFNFKEVKFYYSGKFDKVLPIKFINDNYLYDLTLKNINSGVVIVKLM